jgi:hypothetical protein
MAEPAAFAWAEPWYRRRGVRMTGVVVAFLLLAALSAKALVRGGRRAEQREHTADGTESAAAAQPAPPAANAAPPIPPPAAVPAPAPAPIAAAPPAPVPAASADAAAVVTVAGKPEPPPAPAKVAANTPEQVPPKPSEKTPPEEERAPAEKIAPDEAEDDAAAAAHAETPRGEAAAHPASVSVSVKSDPDGTRVSTRHKSYGTTPLSIKLAPGYTYELNFNKAGYAPLSKRYTAGSRAGQSVRVTLTKLPEPPKKVEPEPAPPPPPRKKGWFSR